MIEAVFEDEALKRDVFERLDAILRARGRHRLQHFVDLDNHAERCGRRGATQAISSARISSRRSRACGSSRSSRPMTRIQPTRDAIAETLRAIGKTPIRVKDVVGFAVNRLLHALVLELIRLVEEGVCSAADIDAACKLGLGHPIGPFELLDNTQNSLSLSVHEILHQAYGERFLPRPLLRQMVAAGYNGRKAGRGWYRYDKDGRRL